jgi:hypothetical protein
MGNKEQRHETGNRGWETRNRDLRLEKEDGRQGTETTDWGQRMGDMEQRHETGNRGWETRNIEVKQGTEDGDKEQRSVIGTEDGR